MLSLTNKPFAVLQASFLFKQWSLNTMIFYFTQQRCSQKPETTQHPLMACLKPAGFSEDLHPSIKTMQNLLSSRLTSAQRIVELGMPAWVSGFVFCSLGGKGRPSYIAFKQLQLNRVSTAYLMREQCLPSIAWKDQKGIKNPTWSHETLLMSFWGRKLWQI